MAPGSGSPIPAHDLTSRTFATLRDLSQAAQRRAALDAEIDAIVRGLVARGIGWGDIGRALGITRQGARQRYGAR